MSDAALEVRNILRNDADFCQYFLSADNQTMIFSYNIPLNLVEKTDSTLLVTDVLGVPSDYGADHAQSLIQTIQIQIWYQAGSQVDEIIWSLNKLLEDNGFYMFTSNGATPDEETLQLKTTAEFRRIKSMR